MLKIINKVYKIASISFLGIFLSCSQTTEKIEGKNLRVSYKVLADSLKIPWEIIWGKDQALWMTDHSPNRIVRLDPETMNLDTYTVNDPSLDAKGNHIIHGIEQHPNYPKDPYFYISHGYISEKNPNTMIMTCKKYTLDFQKKEFSDPQIIIDSFFTQNSMLPGGYLKIVKDSLLLLATSDETDHNLQSRNPNSLSGKILCYDLNGLAVGDGLNKGNPIFAMGIRNAQGIAETDTGELFFCDHGPSSDDEVNKLVAGGDYGWPDVLGSCDTDQEKEVRSSNDVIEPLISWTPTIAPSSLAFYNHSRYPALKNTLLLTTLKEADIRILKLNKERNKIVDEEILLDNEFGRIRDIVVSDDGRIFITTGNRLPKSFRFALPEAKQDMRYDVVVELFFNSKKKIF